MDTQESQEPVSSSADLFASPAAPPSTGSSEDSAALALPDSLLDSMDLGKSYPPHMRWTLSNLLGRQHEVATLTNLLGQSEPTVPAIFINGHTATGKTLVMKLLMEEHAVFHAFVSCVDKYTPRLLFESVINQLSSHTPSAANGYTSYARCDNLNEFVHELVAAIDRKYAVGSSASFTEEVSARVSAFDAEAPPHPTVHIVLDNAERLRDLGMPTLLPTLLRLREIARRNVCVTLISELVWDKFRAGTGSREPFLVYFSPYPKDTATAIICAECPVPSAPLDFYRQFVGLLWDVFHRPCKDLNELRHLAHLLFPVYYEPIERGTIQRSESVKLWKHIDPYFRKVLSKLYLRELSVSEWQRIQETDAASGSSSTSISSRLDVELPFYSKFLLLAAYLASYNPSRLDSSLFAKKKTEGRRGGIAKKKAAAAGPVKSAERAAQRLLGPKPFPLDRLMAIFYSIVDEKADGTADLQLQISTLVTLHLLTRTGSADNLDSVRYRCNISLEFALSVAKSVKFDLSRFIQA